MARSDREHATAGFRSDGPGAARAPEGIDKDLRRAGGAFAGKDDDRNARPRCVVSGRKPGLSIQGERHISETILEEAESGCRLHQCGCYLDHRAGIAAAIVTQINDKTVQLAQLMTERSRKVVSD